MPKSRGSDLPQRQSPHAPLHLKTTAYSEINAIHRSAADRSSPKVEDRRSPRNPLAPQHERKRGVKVADLETKLGKAQEELKKLRDQLVSAETAKHDADQALQKAKKRIPVLAQSTKGAEEEKPPVTPPLPLDSAEKICSEHELKAAGKEIASSQATTDVFEVVAPSELVPKEQEGVGSDAQGEDAVAEKMVGESKADAGGCGAMEGENEDKDVISAQVAERGEEMLDLKAKLLEKEREVEFLLEENAIFKRKAKEEDDKIAAAARDEEQFLEAKLRAMEEELKESRAKAEDLEEQLGTAKSAKATLEVELKRLKVQTDQWRKAAEAAAAALSDGEDMCGKKVAERCGPMDKHMGGGVYDGWDSPLMAGDMDDDVAVGSSGRRKASGIRMFGDIWKKKGQQK